MTQHEILIKSLSPAQYAMLKDFAKLPISQCMSEEDVGAFKQTTFRSMLYQRWVAWNGRGFIISKNGREALRKFEHGEIMRKVSSLQLTSYWVRPKSGKVRFMSAA